MLPSINASVIGIDHTGRLTFLQADSLDVNQVVRPSLQCREEQRLGVFAGHGNGIPADRRILQGHLDQLIDAVGIDAQLRQCLRNAKRCAKIDDEVPEAVKAA